MKISKDAWILIFVLGLFVYVTYKSSVDSKSKADAPSTYSTRPQGAKAFYLLLKEEGSLRVERHSTTFKTVPRQAKVIFITDYWELPKSDTKALVNWVKRGNTLIIGLSEFLMCPDEFGLWADAPDNRLKETNIKPEPGKYVDGVKKVYVEPQSLFVADKTTTPLIEYGSKGTVAVEHKLGRGRVIALGDPLILSNSRIRDEDNAIFVTNLVYENTRSGDMVLFSEYKPRVSQNEKVPPELGLGAKLGLSLLGFVTLLVLITAGTRFGAIQPLVEKNKHQRAWELVGAMAGLYRRAEARSSALTSISHSFMRELIIRFGVSPDATAVEAADTVLRARSVDRARLILLLERCKAIENGQPTTDYDVLKLAKSIEEFRRELGIARSTND